MNAAVAQERWQGQIIDGKFPVLEWIGGSANTAVFRTQLPGEATQSAAIKLVRAESVNAAQLLSTWKQLLSLSHPNLLRLFDAGHCQINATKWVYCVLEYAEENLEQVVPVRSLSTAEVADLLPPIFAALSFLHSQALIHGDLKPSNIFAVKNQVKLAIDTVQPAGQTSNRGESAYDPPEGGPLTKASDLWSLGMTIVSVFNQGPLQWSRAAGVIPPVPKQVPSPYRLIASECLRIDPAERCSLQRIGELLNPQRPATRRSTAQLSGKTQKLSVLVAAVVVIAIIVAMMSRHLPSKTAARPIAAQEAASPSATPVSASSSPVLQRSGVSERVLPQVPRSARETIHGKVRVKVRISVDSSGKVSSAVLSSPGPSKYFARLALEASRKWQFIPAEVNGQPTQTQWVLEYKFGRSTTEVIPTQLHE